MKIDLRLLLDDIINKAVNYHDKEDRGMMFKLGYGKIKITTHDDLFGCSASLIDKEELKAAKKWIDDKISARRKEFLIRKYGLIKDDNEHLKDLEDDIKRGIK